MRIRKTDVAIIGAGTAGLGAFHAARKAGADAVLIESGVYGTTCARVGCMPSKLLIAAADAAYGARQAGGFGVKVGSVCVDAAAVMSRVRNERDRFVGFVVQDVDALPAELKLRGEARFKSANVLQVGDHTEVHAKAVVIATGSRPVVPDMLKSLGDRVIVNDDVFDWESLPKRVAVFGPGVIGLELGQALARLGVHICMFGERGSVAALSDPEVREQVKQIFQREFYLDPDARDVHAERDGDKVVVFYTRLDNRKVTEYFDYALAATGRVPNLEPLDLKNAGLSLDDDGVPVFDRKSMQCGDSPIFLAGDVNADVPFLHEASDEGRIAGANAARFPDIQSYRRRAPLAVVYSDPQIAVAGARYAQIEGEDIVIGSASFEDQGRARVIRQNRGLIRVYARCGKGELLGAEMVAPSGEHLGHLLAWAVQQKLTVAEVLDMPFYHPTLEEGMQSALRDAVRQLKQTRQQREKVAETQ